MFIDRIKQVNGIINAVVHDRFEIALTEARAVDEIIRQRSLSVDELKIKKPLFGVPFTSKESTAAEGFFFLFFLIF